MKDPWEVAEDVWMSAGRGDVRRTLRRAWNWHVWAKPLLKWVGAIMALVGTLVTLSFFV